ncbi:MAG: type IX secretion system membrane protein PorP/SprF [Prevotella sp.]|nr:type IX secretion system membrane protein PorP/SprF [Prevotella sp.]MBR1556963.1 type IX secretion system membrane protein PorP/SprF [Prevotella sp.]
MKRFKLVLVGLLFAATRACGQYDANFAHYWAMEPSFNPATVGKEAKLNAVGAYAIQLAGFEHNPQTMYAAADMPFYALGSYHGVGVQLLNDEIGLFSHKRLSLQYAYQRRLFGGRLSLGVQAGMLGETFDGSKLEVEDSTDPALSTSSVNGTGFDLSAGVYFQARRWYVGLSVLHLNSPVVAIGETNELSIDPAYYFTAGYNIQLNHPFLKVQTSVLGRTDGVAWRADVTGRLKYEHDKKVMYVGLTYSPTNSVTVLIGGNLHGIHLGYSYEIYTSAINIGNGSHELFVGYQTELNLYKKGRNLHKSVRLL